MADVMDSLRDFMEGSLRNSWITIPHMNVYVRKGTHLHPISKAPIQCLDVANISVTPSQQGQGIFTEWLQGAIEMAEKCGMSAVHVECVLTDRFAEHFRQKKEWIETRYPPSSFFLMLPRN